MAEEKAPKSESSKKEDQPGVNRDLNAGQGDVQKAMDEINAQGFMGQSPLAEHNEAYTVSGVTSDKPTPENDDDLFHEARAISHGNPRTAVDQSAAHVHAEGGKRKKLQAPGTHPPKAVDK